MLVYLWLLATAAAAQLRLTMPTRALTEGQTVQAELQLLNARTNARPDLEVGDGLQVTFQGTSQSITQVNLKTTRILTFNVAVTALQAGTWQIGPASLIIDGEPVVAPPVTVQVRARSEADRERADVTATLSSGSPYVGEVEVYRFQFRRKEAIYDARWTPPQFEGFIEARDAETVQQEYALIEDGERVTIQDVFVPLMATKAGEHTITPALLDARVPDQSRRRRRDPMESLFGRSTSTRSETYRTEPLPVSIRPLPEAGRPADFSGLVGSFTLRVQPSAREIPLGESVTIEARMDGDGSLSGFKLPVPVQEGFRTYDDDASYTARVIEGRYRSSAVFRRALVPETVGDLVVPPIEVTAFDPLLEQYVTLRSAPLTLRVLPGEEDAGAVTSFSEGSAQRPVEALGDDILPAPGAATVRDRSLRGALPWLLAAPSVPALALFGLWGWSLRPTPAPGPGLRARLDALPDDPDERLSSLEAVFRDAAGLRLNRPSAGLTRDDLAALGEDVVALYDALSRARYGGSPLSDLTAQVRAFVLEATA
ncbi:MAG: BatD family protein [Myxococcota bacterium]